MILAPLFLAAALPALAAGADSAKTEMTQDITVVGKSAGPTLALPPPGPSKPVVDEVLQSLSLGRGEGPAGPETVRVTPETARLSQPFPEAPFLALSPENIRAQYDSWVFDIRTDDGEIASRAEGVGRLRDTVDWDGAGPDGRLEIVPGKRYRYRFTGTRGGRTFVIESDPVALESFTRREYGGETRMEAASEEIFIDGKAAFATGAERYLNPMADALRAGDARADGSYKFELYDKRPRGKLAKARVKALVKRFAAALHADERRVKVAALPAERAEALAAFVPPAKGARFLKE